MAYPELESKILVIFENEQINYRRKESTYDGQVHHISLLNNPTQNALRLRSIYSKIPEEDKRHLKELLHSAPKEISYLSFEFFLRCHLLTDALQVLDRISKDDFELVLERLYALLEETPRFLNYSDLDSVKTHVKDGLDAFRTVLYLLNGEELDKLKNKESYRAERIQDEYDRRKYTLSRIEEALLEKINYLQLEDIDKEFAELYTGDIVKVIEKIGDFDLDPSLSQTLEKIKKYYQTAEDKFDFATGTSFIRSFFDDLVIDVAKKISQKKKEEIPKSKDSTIRESEFTRCKNYLERVGLISEMEKGFIGSFNSLLSSKGSHNRQSDKECFRLCTNMAVELTLLVLVRVDDMKN